MSKNPPAMRPKLELTVKTTLRNRVTLKTRFTVAAGTTLALAALVGASVFIYGNFGNSGDAQAALGLNMGFENGTAEWSNVSGSWSVNSTASNVRSGSKSVQVTAANNADV